VRKCGIRFQTCVPHSCRCKAVDCPSAAIQVRVDGAIRGLAECSVHLKSTQGSSAKINPLIASGSANLQHPKANLAFKTHAAAAWKLGCLKTVRVQRVFDEVLYKSSCGQTGTVQVRFRFPCDGTIDCSFA
jgi:hypothetical protein